MMTKHYDLPNFSFLMHSLRLHKDMMSTVFYLFVNSVYKVLGISLRFPHKVDYITVLKNRVDESFGKNFKYSLLSTSVQL